MKQDNVNRFVTMARDYDEMAPYLVPQYNLLQESTIEYFNLEQLAQPVIVDLGAGSGIFLERILSRNKSALCYWVDSSPAFLDIAQQKLARYKNRVTFILSAMEAAWEQQMTHEPDFMFSMSAIHHLENEEKKELYQRCFELLAEKGWLVNIDEMKTIYDDAYYNSLLYWARHVDQSQSLILQDKRDLYFKWVDHFDRWKARNIANFNQPKTKGDDLHEVFTLQMQWLQEIGFVNVDIFLKYHLWCMVGGQKPAAFQKENTP
ncbi:MAG: class I SAM-dependent methyltransferase [Anaerolineae bacterium]|nr:class I SAM-dependent methyltransferase [Anaerolineae bacterium]